jgi:hypothetical protein
VWSEIEGSGGSINLCKEKYMEEGYKKCPKCDGNGKQEYVYFQIGAILENLASLKKGKTIDNLTSSERQIRIICPFCEGTGKVDWISWARRKSYSKPFSKLEGCLDILLDELRVHLWYSNPPDRNGEELIDDISEYSNPENIIKFSQKRYDEPIKLNNDFLSMTADELKKIEGILNWHHLEIPKPYTEEKIEDYLKRNGLSKYKPDKFAYPDPDDFDEQFY